ncbi:MAG: hypothetical protein WC917_03965 [Bacilli bacterium]|jgi:hypothetical protein
MFKVSFEVKINSCQHGTTNTSGICNKYLGSEKITEEGIKNFVGNVPWVKRKREEQKETVLTIITKTLWSRVYWIDCIERYINGETNIESVNDARDIYGYHSIVLSNEIKEKNFCNICNKNEIIDGHTVCAKCSTSKNEY